MRAVTIHPDFASWRTAARALLQAEVPPQEIVWFDDTTDAVLPDLHDADLSAPVGPLSSVPKEFLSLARTLSHHRDPARWPLLYELLWRLTHGEPNLLAITVDDAVYRAQRMQKAVTRDVHKAKAFVRFRRVVDDAGEHFIAWHRSDHFIVPLAGPWFAKRFAAMRWTILTPDASVSWDLRQLHYGPGVPASAGPQSDDLEILWRTYYASIFNPARVKVAMMKREMPVRYWATLPEADLIEDLLQQAPVRVETMMKNAPRPLDACAHTTSAAPFVPHSLELPVLRNAAAGCQGCDIYCNATQVVFGEGPETAEVMFVGEQPGDNEDRAGKPFIGPAGQVLNQALQEAKIDRDIVYVTNAVKHFKFEPRGPRRIHAKPNAREMAACRPWLEAEIASVRPKLIVCLGATAAQSLMGPQFRITKDRGHVFDNTEWAPALIATYHPSAILRQPDEQSKAAAYAALVEDLGIVRQQMHAISRDKAETSARRMRSSHPGQEAAAAVPPPAAAPVAHARKHAPEQPGLFGS